MRNHLFLLLSCTALLSACGSINDQHVSTDELLEMMDGPKIQGVDSTLVRLAQNAEQQGAFTQAAQHYKQLADNNPANMDYNIRLGENLRKSGELQKALGVFHSVLVRHPNHVEALEGKGLTLLSLANTEEAGVALNQVVAMAPQRWRTLNAMGILFLTKAMNPQAQQYFNEALKYQPNHPAILNNQGLALALVGNYPQALETLFAASRNAQLPKHQAQADLNAALVYAIAGDTEQARMMAARHLQGAGLQNNLGLYAHLAQDEQLAKTHLHMALSASHTFYEKAWNNLAILQSANTSANNQ